MRCYWSKRTRRRSVDKFFYFFENPLRFRGQKNGRSHFNGDRQTRIFSPLKWLLQKVLIPGWGMRQASRQQVTGCSEGSRAAGQVGVWMQDETTNA